MKPEQNQANEHADGYREHMGVMVEVSVGVKVSKYPTTEQVIAWLREVVCSLEPADRALQSDAIARVVFPRLNELSGNPDAIKSVMDPEALRDLLGDCKPGQPIPFALRDADALQTVIRMALRGLAATEYKAAADRFANVVDRG